MWGCLFGFVPSVPVVLSTPSVPVVLFVALPRHSRYNKMK
jgi:hypothetical protein